MLDLTTKKMFVSRDLIFYEDRFSFATISTSSSQIFTPYPSSFDVSYQPYSPLYNSQTNTPATSCPYVLPSLSPISIASPTSDPIIPHIFSPKSHERISCKPGYLKNFICNSVYLINLTNSCFASPLPASNFCLMLCLSLTNEFAHSSPPFLNLPTILKLLHTLNGNLLLMLQLQPYNSTTLGMWFHYL